MIKALIGLGALATLAALLILVQPGEYVVRRQLVMGSSPAEVYRILADFREWEAWGQMQRVQHSLPPVNAETGEKSKEMPASFTWSSEGAFGAGKLTLGAVKPGESVRVKIDLDQPYQAQGEMIFNLEQDGYEVTVAWTITMQNSLSGKAQYLLSDRGAAVGAEMEACLKRIKQISETWTKFRRQNKNLK